MYSDWLIAIPPFMPSRCRSSDTKLSISLQDPILSDVIPVIHLILQPLFKRCLRPSQYLGFVISMDSARRSNITFNSAMVFWINILIFSIISFIPYKISVLLMFAMLSVIANRKYFENILFKSPHNQSALCRFV